MILFLDFDGVLHSREVSFNDGNPQLHADGRLFEHADSLYCLLINRQDVKIVLSTPWVAHLGFDNAKAYLPMQLQYRVIGSTWHSQMPEGEWLNLSRHEQIQRYVQQHKIADWLALEASDAGWPESSRLRLILCENAHRGLREPNTYIQLTSKLSGIQQVLKVEYLPTNSRGRDFVIGDLHGEFATLQKALDIVSFDFERDRLLAVGDLIDRGPNSADCLRLTQKPWFHSALGNHEDMMLASFQSPGKQRFWFDNGGRWWLEESEESRTKLLELAACLPHVLVIGEGDARFNVLHAEYEDDDAGLFDGHYLGQGWDEILWGRSNISHYNRSCVAQEYWPKKRVGLSPTFVGHVTLPDGYVELDSHIYLDTGTHLARIRDEGFLSMAELVPGTNRIRTIHQIEVVLANWE